MMELSPIESRPTVQINRIATGVPDHDIHATYLQFARTLLESPRAREVFDRMAAKTQIAHRYSVLAPSERPDGPSIDEAGAYTRGRFPTVAERMKLFEAHAPRLAAETIAKLDLGASTKRISHVIVTTCTGMYAPGLDLEIVTQCGLDPRVERTMVGFMGCYAAITGLKLAYHIVRSAPKSRVLLVNLELCTLHLQETTNIEQMLSFLIFGDGCAASLVSADPIGFTIDRFQTAMVPGTADLITWKIRDLGFDMHLSSRVPAAISHGLESVASAILDGSAPEAIDLWAVHPGGRAVLDAVEHGLALEPSALAASRAVLANFGNLSSAAVMFVLQSLLARAESGERGCAMSFGPGLTAETMLFHKV